MYFTVVGASKMIIGKMLEKGITTTNERITVDRKSFVSCRDPKVA